MCPGDAEETTQCEQISALLSRVGDKWTVLVVGVLGKGPTRFNALRRSVGDISQKMLATTLRNLERDGFVSRTVTPTNPPQVEYALTDLGVGLLEPVRALAEWTVANADRIEAARRAFAARRRPRRALARAGRACFLRDMSKPADNPADPFKKALAEATRAMAGERELTVAYSVDPPGCAAGTMRLPQVTRRLTRDEVMLARGTADAFALRLRYHDDGHPPAVCAGRRDGGGALRGDGDRALRGGGGAGDARHRRQHRRADRRETRGAWAMARSPIPGRRRWRRPRATWCGISPRGGRCPRRAQNVMELWRGHLE